MNRISRRQWLGNLAAAGLWSAADQRTADGDYQLFWGDLHNHCDVGYARGSVERAYDVARNHLDFYAFTPHAQWHDMPRMPNNAHDKWVKGFEVLRERWPKVQKLAAAANEPGKFACFLAYEWHSSGFGDYCLYYPRDGMPLEYFDHVRGLQKHARSSGAVIIPHHLAYKQGWRGANWAYLNAELSPVLEIYSEHGLSEHDRGVRDFIRHSNGGRWTRNTLQAALRAGFRVGVIASSDNHLGYPGAYGEGLAGIFARELSREALFEGLRARRTLAVTGDRIALVFKLNRQWMGSVMPWTLERVMDVYVSAKDDIQQIEILRNNSVVHRHFPFGRGGWTGEALCRLEFGWGPWAALNMARVCDWDVEATVHSGKLVSITPCFQSGPLDEERRNRIVARTENSCRFQLYTSRRDAFEERATNSVILQVTGAPDAALEVVVSRPARVSLRRKLAELAENNEIEFTGAFTSESFVVHRLVTPALFRASTRFTERATAAQTDWYYARVTQANGHQAWSSPIWVEGPAC